ncbi:MAG: molybdenum cofactor carrier [Rhodospirillaceae bacterium]|nr:molybdenum cofactor carrier [Rhodospirillaceae bacterium]
MAAGPFPEKIVSGGQTGGDRAALDAALALGIPCGGWCPKGRRAEDGAIPERYPVAETESEAYEERTRLNVGDADATLILASGPLSGGTGLTAETAEAESKRLLVADPLTSSPDAEAVNQWLAENEVRVLNVAGPRESTQPGIHRAAADFLTQVLALTRRPS